MNLNRFIKCGLLTVWAFVCVSGNGFGSINVVPRPQEVTELEGMLKVKPGKLDSYIIYKVDQALGEEAYTLEVSKKSIIISSSSDSGKFYALQTLKQMMSPSNGESKETELIPCCVIKDAPAFRYRGAHLDVCRHFFTKEDVKKYIDIMALHKLNRLHWHLTEDQGWRLEIKAYPKLTQIGAWRDGTMIGKDWASNDGKRHGGFYTQDDAREIVRYAAERFITVIPEIEIPGHARAALASYPELGCRGKDYTVATTWGVFPEVFCPGKEETFKFWETVLTEVIGIFPSKYIHIGGDECPKDEWKKCPLCQKRIKEEGLKNEAELQSYVTRRVEAFLNDRGRSIIGWDEILEGGVTPTATIMSWRGVAGGIQAAKSGNHVIMTPTDYCYLDYYQTKEESKTLLGIGGYVPLEKCYSFDPYNGLDKSQQRFIMGVQGNLWTEYISEFERIQYNLLPRVAALAEVGWTYGKKDFADFRKRMMHLKEYYDAYGWKYGELR